MTPQGRAGGAHQDTQRAVSWARGSGAGAPADGSARLGADPSGCTHLLAWAAGCSAPRWKGKRNSSLLPRLPELTRMTLMGLVLSPMPARLGTAWPAGRRHGSAGFRFRGRRCFPRPLEPSLGRSCPGAGPAELGSPARRGPAPPAVTAVPPAQPSTSRLRQCPQCSQHPVYPFRFNPSASTGCIHSVSVPHIPRDGAPSSAWHHGFIPAQRSSPSALGPSRWLWCRRAVTAPSPP